MTLIPPLRRHLWATEVYLQQFSNTELCFVFVLSSAFCISPDTSKVPGNSGGPSGSTGVAHTRAQSQGWVDNL